MNIFEIKDHYNLINEVILMEKKVGIKVNELISKLEKKGQNILLCNFILSKIIIYSFRFLIFISFKIFYFKERNLIKIFKTYIDDKIYSRDISLDSS